MLPLKVDGYHSPHLPSSDKISATLMSRYAILLLTFWAVNAACRPVFAIGWKELLLLGAIIALLFGPALLRFYRRWETFQRQRNKDR
ncbi:MAG: hypothetical protein D6803_07620 [Anaerolineae bacterium]|nr:MAG: hypothetical protein D6803_07620 [Anaerolineae bacterium]